MTLDTSALIAVLFSEPGYLDVVDRILEADTVRVGAPTLVETSLVFAGRRGRPAGRELEALVEELDITIVPFGEAEWRRAAEAFARYGPRPAQSLAQFRGLPGVRDGGVGQRLAVVRGRRLPPYGSAVRALTRGHGS